MKRLLLLLLSLVLIMGVLTGCGAKVDKTTLIVGSEAISGDFVAGFGNTGVDASIRALLYGYGTYVSTPAGEIVLNETAVKNVTAEKDAAGNKTYTFELYDDLKWNDGSPVTAQDYVFSMLWSASPQWLEAGASTTDGDGLVGYTAYYEGTSDRFQGVKLIDEHTFSFTIAKEDLPYFFETAYVSLLPYPMAVWAPGATIDSNEQGAKIAGVDLKAATAKIASEERFKPTVTCGPYSLVSFENNSATMKRNEHFKGNYEGKLPQLENVIVRTVNLDTNVDQVINGEIDLSPGVIEGEKIEKAKAAKTAAYTSRLRAGFGGVFIHCDFGPTKDANVRQALAYLIDRDEVIANVLGGYGSVVNSEYGLAQWMYQENKAAIDALPHFTRDIQKANDFLDQTEWKYEADGVTPFDPAKANADGTYLRYNAQKEPLTVNHFGSEENDVTDNVEIQFKGNAPLAGMDFTLTRGDFDALIDNYYYGFQQGADRRYHTFNLATDFTPVFDPYYNLHSDFVGTWMNAEQLSDPELDRIMVAMRSLEPEQRAEFSQLWLQYEQRYAQVVPAIPLYSNEYFDIYSSHLKGMNTTPFADWADIICDLYKE